MGVIGKTAVVGSGVGAVVGVIAGTVIGWAVVWNWLSGWWTPGWGNLFTVAIASAALGVGVWFNRQTLARADERHDQIRRDARTDKLRLEIAAVLSAAGQRRSQMEVFAKQVNDLIAATNGIAERPNLLVAVQAALNESVGALYAKIRGHIHAVRMLTSDSHILDRLGVIEIVLDADMRDYAEALENAPKPRDAVFLGRIQKRRDAQTRQLAETTEQLLTYCSAKFSALD
jgi:hypothetical protein